MVRDPKPISKDDVPKAFGVFKPVGHVVIAFAAEDGLQGARRELKQVGYADQELVIYTPQEMKAEVDREAAHAGPLASLGQEMNLAKFHAELAEQGHWWLIVLAPEDSKAQNVAEIAKRHGARLAQKYNQMTIEELI